MGYPCGGCESQARSPKDDLTSIAWAEGRAMTLEQAIEYALTPAG